MKKRGRPKVKKAEFKKPFPMRFSAAELKAFKQAAGKQPLRDWMRVTLIAATPFAAGVRAMIDEAVGYPPATERSPARAPLSSTVPPRSVPTLPRA